MNAGTPIAGSQTSTQSVQPDLRTLSAESINQQLQSFYTKEQQRQVRFQHVAVDGAPYDIIILHVCSLSWDDLDDIGKRNDPLLKRFNITFSNFNSAASYSGPAAIRLLRGNCGQGEHKTLYDPAARECLVLDGLQDAGFVPQWAMNHDGHFGNFFADVRDRGGMPVRPEDASGATIAQRSFDGTPVYDDYSVLSRWWQKRQSNPADHMVLYYNTVSLHDGNKLEGKGAAQSSYTLRFDQFSRSLNHFMDDVQRSGRRVIVVFISEHGAALRGDRRQIQGLREIPTPAITHVPMGMVLINAGVHSPATVDVPTSYLAVNELLSRFIADNPFAKDSVSLDAYLNDLPKTDSIAENEGTVVFTQGQQSMMRTPDGAWSAWDQRT
jgi:cellulose synthase operon protein YhjU